MPVAEVITTGDQDETSRWLRWSGDDNNKNRKEAKSCRAINHWKRSQSNGDKRKMGLLRGILKGIISFPSESICTCSVVE